MNVESKLRELVVANLADNHFADGVRFIDQLLPIASEVGEVRCSLAGEDGIRFQLPHQPAWDMKLGRARTKLRLLCARLGIVCQAQNGRFVNLYGDEADVEDSVPSTTPKRWHVSFENTPSHQGFLIQSR